MVKLAYQHPIDEVSLLLLRMLFALPFYLLVWAFNFKKWQSIPLRKKEYGLIVLIGIVGYYLASFFDFKGLTYISASLERLILFTYPTIVLILSIFILKKKVTRAQIGAIFITYAGLAIIFSNGSTGIVTGTKQDVLFGVGLILLSAFTYALYLVGSNFLIARVGSQRLTTFSLIISCIAVIIHFLLTASASLWGYPNDVYVIAFLMAIFATVIPSFLIVEAISRIGAPSVSIIGSLGPVSTILLSMIFLGEALTLIQFAGTLVIISGVAIISYSKN